MRITPKMERIETPEHDCLRNTTQDRQPANVTKLNVSQMPVVITWHHILLKNEHKRTVLEQNRQSEHDFKMLQTEGDTINKVNKRRF